MDFINRENELKAMNEEFLSKKSSLIIIYGRRRVGKTALIEQFIKNKQAIYLLADLQKEKIQINRFKSIIAHHFNDQFLKSIEIDDWDALFNYFEKQLNIEKKLILVIDEFQYLAKVNKPFPSILQRIWDSKLKNKNIMLILCGSLISMIHDIALHYNSPLYGRRTLQMKIKPFSFESYKNLFKDKDIQKIIELYSITNGIPKYIELIDPAKDIWDNISEKIIDRNSFLFAEPRFVLSEEITDATTYFSIMQVISQGDHKIGNIANKLGIHTPNLTSHLDKLRELEIIERIVPVTETNPAKSKKGLYFIKDNFFRFWFRYVYPFQGYLEINNKEIVMDKIKKDFNQFVAYVFEGVCKEFTLNQQLPFRIKKIGKWWDRQNEIDIVAMGDNEILYGECKWWTQKVDRRVLDELIYKANFVNWNNDKRKEFFAIYSKAGFTIELKQLAKKESNVFLYSFDNYKLFN